MSRGKLLVFVTIAALIVACFAGGAIFGLVWGVIRVSFAPGIGVTLAFLTSCFLLRDWVQGKCGDKQRAYSPAVPHAL